MGRFDEAVPHFEELVAGRERTLGPNHAKSISAVSALGVARLDRGDLEEARLLFEPALEHARTELGTESKVTAKLQKRLVSCYEALHEEDPSLGFDGLAAGLGEGAAGDG